MPTPHHVGLLVLAAISIPLVVKAATVQNVTYSGNASYIINPTNNLVAGLTPSSPDVSKFTSTEGTSGSLSTLTDGSFPDMSAAGTQWSSSNFVAVYEGGQLTYNPDILSNTGGFNITSIETYSGWADHGRDDQNFVVSYSTVADPTTFITLFSTQIINQSTLQPSGEGDGAISPYPPVFIPGLTGLQAENTDNGLRAVFASDTGLLAAHVAAIRFDFGPQENGYAGYAELAVYGAPVAVPEPRTMGLVAAAAQFVGISFRRRKRA